MALLSSAIGKHREVRWGLLQPSEFEPRVKGRARRRLGRQRLGIAACKNLPNLGAKRLVVDNDEPPRLAQPNGRSEAPKLNEVFNRTDRQSVPAKTPYIAPPPQKIAQLCSESFIKSVRPIGHQHIFFASHGSEDNRPRLIRQRVIDERQALRGAPSLPRFNGHPCQYLRKT